jgi:hypothetical protein
MIECSCGEKIPHALLKRGDNRLTCPKCKLGISVSVMIFKQQEKAEGMKCVIVRGNPPYSQQNVARWHCKTHGDTWEGAKGDMCISEFITISNRGEITSFVKESKPSDMKISPKISINFTNGILQKYDDTILALIDEMRNAIVRMKENDKKDGKNEHKT